MAVTVAEINGFFENYGWQFEFEEDTKTWHTGFRGDSSNFNVYVHLTDNWLYFSISPLVNAPQDPLCEQKLHFFLLRLNHIINLAKFSIDGDGDVVLTVELPTESLDFSEFSDGLSAISFYADAHFLELLNLARDPEYVPTLGEGTPPVEGGGEGGAGPIVN